MMRPATRTFPDDARLLEFFGGLRRVVGQDLLEGVGEFVLAAVGGLAERLNLLQLLAAQVVDVVVECQGSPLVACGGREIINNALRSTWTRLRTELARPQVCTPPPIFFFARVCKILILWKLRKGYRPETLAKS